MPPAPRVSVFADPAFAMMTLLAPFRVPPTSLTRIPIHAVSAPSNAEFGAITVASQVAISPAPGTEAFNQLTAVLRSLPLFAFFIGAAETGRMTAIDPTSGRIAGGNFIVGGDAVDVTDPALFVHVEFCRSDRSRRAISDSPSHRQPGHCSRPRENP